MVFPHRLAEGVALDREPLPRLDRGIKLDQVFDESTGVGDDIDQGVSTEGVHGIRGAADRLSALAIVGEDVVDSLDARSRRRPRASSDGDGGGDQLRRWSNEKAVTGWSSGSAAGSCSVGGLPQRRATAGAALVASCGHAI